MENIAYQGFNKEIFGNFFHLSSEKLIARGNLIIVIKSYIFGNKLIGIEAMQHKRC